MDENVPVEPEGFDGMEQEGAPDDVLAALMAEEAAEEAGEDA